MNNLNVNNIVLGILGLAVAVLFFLHFKSAGPSVKMNATAADVAGAAGSRIAFVNIDTFFGGYKEYKKIKDEIESSSKAASSNLQSKTQALQAEYQKLMQGAQSGQITPQQAQVKEKEIMAKGNALKNEEQSIGKSIADKTEKATKDLYKKMEEYFTENKSKYNCDIVMGYQTNGVLLYVDPKMDITKQVIEDLNK
jgi:outer membrane protein